MSDEILHFKIRNSKTTCNSKIFDSTYPTSGAHFGRKILNFLINTIFNEKFRGTLCESAVNKVMYVRIYRLW